MSEAAKAIIGVAILLSTYVVMIIVLWECYKSRKHANVFQLLPCQLCGRKLPEVTTNVYGGFKFKIVCQCGLKVESPSLTDAIDTWNDINNAERYKREDKA